MPDPLSFGNGANPFREDALSGFDAAPSSDGIDLSGFDRADGKTIIPAGVYVCRVDRGELTTTKNSKPAYRLKFVTGSPAEHAGFAMWKWYVVDPTDAAACNRAKSALSPLGLISGADLRRPFPAIGKTVFVRALVTIRPAKDGCPESNDVERFEPCDPPAGAVPPVNPFAVSLNDTKEGEHK